MLKGKKYSLILLIFILSGCIKDYTINKETKIFEIKKGESFNSVIKRLEDQNIIKSKTRFKVVAKLLRQDNSIKAGVYQINPKTSFEELLDTFSKGRSYSLKITFPEGLNIYQVAEIIEKNNLGKSNIFVNECFNPELINATGVNNLPSVEGFLYPDTYYIPVNYTEKQIILAMINQFKKVVNEDYLKRANELGFDLKKLITFASIIEKETSKEEEKPLVSAVYHNRIKEKMKFQSCPTLIYGLILSGEYKGDIKNEHFTNRSPYNTYMHYGLPPGPIANPGKTSILASLYPAKVKYLFFVSKNDGTHYYSETYEEHLKAVEKYQKKK